MTSDLSKIRHIYAVGDSYTYGDELLENSVTFNPQLIAYHRSGIDFNILHDLRQHNHNEYCRLMRIKNEMTWVGKVAAKMNVGYTNFGQPGSSMSTIIHQIHCVLQDIENNNRHASECLILSGLTSHLRYFCCNTSNSMIDDTPYEFVILTAGSILLSHAECSKFSEFKLAESMGKAFSGDQIMLEYCMNLVNLKHLLENSGAQFKIINLWNSQFMEESFDTAVMKTHCTKILDRNLFLQSIFPSYPTALKDYTYQKPGNLLPKGHPTEEVHASWANMIFDCLS